MPQLKSWNTAMLMVWVGISIDPHFRGDDEEKFPAKTNSHRHSRESGKSGKSGKREKLSYQP